MNQREQMALNRQAISRGQRRMINARASAQTTGDLLSAAERSVLKVFRDFRVGLGEMFCFTGPLLAKHSTSLELLIKKELVVKEQFAGGYSLTPAGYRAMVRPLGSRNKH